MKNKVSALRTFRRPRGFTLVEAVIGISIVTLGSISTISLLMFTRVHNAEEQERARAHQIVSQRMEVLRSELLSAASSQEEQQVWDNGTPDDNTDDTIGTLAVLLRDYDGDLITTPSLPTPGERIQVEVTLSWAPRAGRTNATLRESVMTFMAPK